MLYHTASLLHAASALHKCEKDSAGPGALVTVLAAICWKEAYASLVVCFAAAVEDRNPGFCRKQNCLRNTEIKEKIERE